MVRPRLMHKPLFSARRQALLTSVLLALLLFRAYVPVGFMPASGTPFLLELCPAVYRARMPLARHGHHHSDTTHNQFRDTAPSAALPASGPIAQRHCFRAAGARRFANPSLPFEPAAYQRTGGSAPIPPRGPPPVPPDVNILRLIVTAQVVPATACGSAYLNGCVRRTAVSGCGRFSHDLFNQSVAA